MKRRELEQLKSKHSEELMKILKEHREKLWSLRVDLVSGKVKNVREIHSHRRQIARILTVLNQANQLAKK